MCSYPRLVNRPPGAGESERGYNDEGDTQMPFADLLKEVGARFVSEVGEMAVQEAGRAKEQIAQVFDLRMRS